MLLKEIKHNDKLKRNEMPCLKIQVSFYERIFRDNQSQKEFKENITNKINSAE